MRHETGMKGTYVVIPAFNEAKTIRAVVDAVLACDVDRVIVVDDGSSDGTAAQLRDLDLEIHGHAANLGKGFALASGMQRALGLGAARVVTLDADGQHSAADIHRLEQAARHNPNAVVIAARLRARERAPVVRRFANDVADFWISWACGRRVPDSQSGFRLYPAAMLRQLGTRPRPNEGFAFETAVLIDAVDAGADIVGVPVESRYPACRRASYYRPWRDTWSIVRLVGGRLLRRGMHTAGLRRTLTR
jgi:glycosyltransferase involved in cell wall biosynthesis